jgi:hypothetical protein
LPAIENKKIKNHGIEYDFTYYYIVEYISKILFKYTVNGKLNLLEYFNNVFLKNIDVWGLTMIYMVFLDHLYEMYDDDTLNVYHMQFIDKIKYIIIHFLFENPTEIIDINKLAVDLQSLNNLIANFDTLSIKEKKEEKVNYLLSLTKIGADDIKEIGGNIKSSKKQIRTNKNRENNRRTSRTRSRTRNNK